MRSSEILRLGVRATAIFLWTSSSTIDGETHERSKNLVAWCAGCGVRLIFADVAPAYSKIGRAVAENSAIVAPCVILEAKNVFDTLASPWEVY